MSHNETAPHTGEQNPPMKIIARIRTDFATKFGVPRQAGLVEELRATVVFEPEYRNPDALRGLEGFSHIWLIWQFSQAVRGDWSPTVRPPRLGGNTRMGVFATRSPFRPNAIGLSSVRLVGMHQEEGVGTVLEVAGADLMDGTPIYDIKPYLPYTDSHPEATGGFTDPNGWEKLTVDFPTPLLDTIPPERRGALIGVLEQDPRPSYKKDGDRVYGLTFGGWNVKFRVKDGVLTVVAVE
jgi:tRNA-Thr(GGU) m(6)t(6)A37 methyltransferase TsaA